ncbi:polysaccharide export system periplasmic protein [Zymomonas mobilis subsp. mobilis ZM4 = ATCC 31821]|uniref:Polysaccharide export protein n=1 Tax=Zymomonas mobilis subsp. mobilis (strain ATCC 31821 / ZM4 / CP4) TaxID=264203 RepID=Q5NP25_ZYMMO|nr:polysaccharide biosynthesis/export family protein [Zymomonas mobilis]AAV89535.2 polysaccharide export protein [Zymomonas mobilis subsp. mobilis ZM4 = ATCC 31821]AVZ25829.1 polysaccharide export system periplasmic protein [Zymomonas mobilis subsp. mobilis]AVZ27720.1 polysaccharide export system periplasmic protein [Zymomonas mobilis subsp. mobilis]AVZ42166.1 polysaccharide export system periplasmic protein [Zymomonas mobilis subsp. mobilis ZM4 = ATCC 31821]
MMNSCQAFARALSRYTRSLSQLGCLIIPVVLAGCNSLPSSGPTAHQFLKRTKPGRNPLDITVIDLNQPVNGMKAVLAADKNSEILDDNISLSSAAERYTKENGSDTGRNLKLRDLASEGRVDLIGPGDVLRISIYEAGTRLFIGNSNRYGYTGVDPSASAEHFDIVAVDAMGTIKLPYAGRLRVAGLRVVQIQHLIEEAFATQSQKPQAMVSVLENVANTVYVGGDNATKASRMPLTLYREHLLDAVSYVGGPRASLLADTVVIFSRSGKTVKQRLDHITPESPDNLALLPGDRIELVKRPRTFEVFGAGSRVEQMAFNNPEVSLAEALARGGGPNDNISDPRAVFLMRFVPDETAPNKERPVVYQLNMLDPASYFMAQRFTLRDKDVLYISSAKLTRAIKAANIVNQIFAPLLIARAAAY